MSGGPASIKTKSTGPLYILTQLRVPSIGKGCQSLGPRLLGVAWWAKRLDVVLCVPATIGQWLLMIVLNLVERLLAEGTKASLSLEYLLLGPLGNVPSVFAKCQPQILGEGCLTFPAIYEGHRFSDLPGN